jgi:lipopolysaccharide transport system ATP-binding protein
MSAIKTLCNRAILIEGGRVADEGDVDRVVNRYLSAGSDLSQMGVISARAPRMTNGEARFLSVRLTDESGQDVRQLFFGQKFKVVAVCDVYKEIADGHFEVSISTADGVHVTYSTTIDEGNEPRYLHPGRHTLTATFSNILLPRQYTIDLGVHHQNGTTSDFVQRTLDFRVLKVAQDGDDHYRWGHVRGLVRVPAEWELARTEPSCSAI